jgi:hypothetical protein
MLPKRRWLRFTLASLLLFIALAGYVCKRVLDTVQLHCNQLNVVAELMDRNPTKIWDGLGIPSSVQSGGTGVSVRAPDGWAKDMADWMGLRYEADIVSINLSGERFSWERTMELVRRLPKVKRLWILRCDVPESLIDLIAEMEYLESVTFTDTDITEEMGLALKDALPNARIWAFDDQDMPPGLVTKFEFP